MKVSAERLTLYAVTDRGHLAGKTLYQAVEEAILGGVTLVQLREKELPYADFLAEAKQLKLVTDAYGIPLIINDNINICLECDAAGVHVGQEDLEAGQARKRLGEKKILGVTAKTVEQAQKAQEQGADYLGSGAVFGSVTKKDARKLSLDTLDEICQSVSIPVVAIGGINEETLPLLKGRRMAGVAVSSGLFAQPDPRGAAERLKAGMLQIRKEFAPC